MRRDRDTALAVNVGDLLRNRPPAVGRFFDANRNQMVGDCQQGRILKKG